jgi:hypothetical protein
MISAPPPPPVPSSFQALLAQFPAVLNPSKRLPPTSHGIQHHLQTQGPPVVPLFRGLNPEKLAAAKAEFAALERDGVVRRSNSPWASPLHMVRKADGSLRPCFAAIHHFWYMLEGPTFCIFTDHKPLIYAISKVSEPPSILRG